MPARTAGRKRTIFRQLCELIPSHLVPKLARKHGIKARGIRAWSHTVSMLYAQFTHAIGLNDVCDALRANRASLASIRAAAPPSRNGLSHANRTRDPKMAEDLFWSMLDHFQTLHPGFGGARFRRRPRRFKRTVHVLDSTTIRLFANCMDWAASSICDLYKARWSIGVFFKQIKQTLHVGDFLGHSRGAIEWQLWTALLMYLLLRFLHTCSDWAHSFTRLFTCLRAVLWQRRHLMDYLALYGTAGGSFRILWAPQQAFLPGFPYPAHTPMGQHVAETLNHE